MNFKNLQRDHFIAVIDQLKVSDQNTFSITSCSDYKFLVFYSFINTKTQSEIYPHLKSFAYSEFFDHIEGGFFSQQCLDNKTFNYTKSLTNNADIIDFIIASSGMFFDGIFSVPAIKSCQWIINNLQSSDGYFFLEMESDSNIDSNIHSNNDNTLSNYYCFNHQDIQEQLDKDAYLILMSAYNLNSSDVANTYPLMLYRDVQQIAEHTKYHIKHIPLALESAHQQLISIRNQQLAPAIKQTFNLKANAKIIGSLYAAASLFNRDDFALAANRALDNIYLRYSASQLSATDIMDYQWLLQALLKRLCYQWSDDLFQWLLSVTAELIQEQNFIDSLFANTHSESIINDLNILYLLSSQPVFLDTAELLYNTLVAQLTQPHNLHSELLLSITATALEAKVIVIRGQGFQITNWQQQISSDFKPDQFIFGIDNNSIGPDPKRFPIAESVTAYKPNLDGSDTPITSVDELINCCP